MGSIPPIFGGIGPIVFGIALLCADRLLAPPDEDKIHDLMRRTLTILGWVLIAVGVFGGFLLLAGFISVPVAIVVIPMMMMRKYRANRRALLCSLAVAAERLMPLAPVLEAFADERHWWLSVRARRAALLLRAGMSLPEAIDRCPGLLPREAVMTIHVGYRAGCLAQALREAVAAQASNEGLWHQLVSRILYLGFLVLFAAQILIFVMLKIVPQYKKIFDDFGTRLPPISEWMITLSRALADYWPHVFLLLLLLWILALYAILRYIGWMTWEPPILRRLTRRFHTEAILRSLAMVAERQQPMPEGIAAITQRYPANWIWRRLCRVQAEVTAGRPWCESLAAHGLISQADQAVLEAAQRVGNLAWALREMAASNVRRLVHRLNLAVQLLFPAAILAFGLAEAVFVLGCFIPLIALIQALTRS